MKKQILLIISILFLGILTASMLITSCSKSEREENISYYTCPMHPQIKRDQAGSCPICGMDLVAVKKDQGAHEEHSVRKGIKIDPVHIQNIGVQTGKVAMRSLKRSILAYGKVAHDPELWVAQNEYIEALKLNDRSLIKSTELKLQFLGLSDEWIELIAKKRKANLGLHLPTKNQTGYFEAFLHQGDVVLVKVGQTVSVLDGKGRNLQKGEIAAIGTMVDPQTRFVRALIKAHGKIDFKSNTFTQFKIEIPLGEILSLPSRAILFNGDHNMAYLVTSEGRYAPRKIELGDEGEDFYEVKSGLSQGDTVVINGHFLIDSETQIKTGGSSVHQH